VLVALAWIVLAQGVDPPRSLALSVIDPNPRCGLEPALGASLARWLPGIDILGSDSAGDLSLLVRADLTELAVELRAPSGAALVERRIGRAAFSCEADADAVALIVERYLRDLGWEPGLASVPETATATAAPPLVSPPPIATATAAPAATSPLELHLALTAAGLLELRDRFPVQTPSPELGMVLRLSPRFEITARGRYTFEKSFSVERTLPRVRAAGAIAVTSIGIEAGVGACADLGGPRLCGTILGGAERYSAEVSDQVFQRQPRVVWAPVIAAGAKLEHAFLERLSGFVTIEGQVRPSAPSFFVEDASPTYSLPHLAVTFRLGASVRIF
jgi:hypothetical protein